VLDDDKEDEEGEKQERHQGVQVDIEPEEI
jgi:hypothetical protein